MAQLADTEKTIWAWRDRALRAEEALKKSRPWVQAMCDWAWERGMIAEHDSAHNLLKLIDKTLAE